MKIETTRPRGSRAMGRPRAADGGGGAAGGAGFAAQVGGGRATAPAGGAAPTGPGAPLASLGALLVVQEAVGVGDGRRRRAVRRGHDLLDRLDDLRVALLDGGVPASALRRIAALLEDRAEPADDPDLAAVLHEIEVRAAVELAKLGRA